MTELLGARLAALFALALLSTGGLVAGRGGWIFAKAELAQLLLESAWAETLAAGRDTKPWPWADTWPVGRLTVPRLAVSEIVLAGAHGEAMAFGPGHVASTPPPGREGNVAVGGHRDTHFRFLKELVVGDEILLTGRDGVPRRYRVAETAIVDHRDLRATAPTLAPTLTLITCYPFDALAPGGPLRYVVRAAASSSRSRDSISCIK